jgi:hypothetical protein
MNEEYEPVYTPFWPLLILTVGLVFWSGYQAFSAYSQNSQLNSEFQGALPTINAAQTAKQKLYSLAQDLVQTGAHDQYAADIVKEANISIKSGPGGDTNSPSATPPDSKTP